MAAIGVKDVCALMSVWDMPATVRFYCELLGFEILNRSPTYAVENGVELFHWCLLKSNSASVMLNTEYDEGERPAVRPAHDGRFGTWFYYDCPDVDAAYEALNAAGVECEPPKLTKYGGVDAFRTLSLRDPDGRRLTLQQPV